MSAPVINRLTIIGLGLIGSSIARAVRTGKIVGTVIGCDTNEISLAYARKHDFIDEMETDPVSAVKNSDMVILAIPAGMLEEIAGSIAAYLKPGAILMDVCSVKEPAIAAIARYTPHGVYYIPAHPIAGSEHSGITAGRADLFAHKRVIITPDEPLQEPLLGSVTAFWEGMGARVEGMPAHLHDRIYAYVSHLPQLLAFAATALVPTGENEALKKFLRLGASSPQLWAGIFTLNSANLLKALDRYLDAIDHICKELAGAPDDTPTRYNEEQARSVLFPRIASSCLITTVMEAEKTAGFSFARYAGTGFADFTFPTRQPPEEDMENISAQYQIVGTILAEYATKLKSFREALAQGANTIEMLLG